MLLFITSHILMLKSECVLQLMGIFNAPLQLILSWGRAHGDSVKGDKLRHEGAWDHGGEWST